MEERKVWAGISLGSKYSGDSAIAIFSNQQIFIVQPDEGVDSDAFTSQVMLQFEPTIIAVDAPLSLPGAITDKPGYTNYHFRIADLECNLLSPMIIGGRTARSMELATTWKEKGSNVFETAPRVVAQQFGLCNLGYRKGEKQLRTCVALLRASFNPDIHLAERDISNWTRLDALLALMTAMKLATKTATSMGHPSEGLIWV